ncbi:hypothetical protein [Lacunimicrobium album]
MDDLFLLDGIDGWEQVLACYAQETAEETPDSVDPTPTAEAAEDESAEPAEGRKRATQPWKKRMGDTLGLDEAQVSKIHGRLVASGLLEIDVVDRNAGLCYRLTRDGKRILKNVHVETTTNEQVAEEADYKMSA